MHSQSPNHRFPATPAAHHTAHNFSAMHSSSSAKGKHKVQDSPSLSHQPHNLSTIAVNTWSIALEEQITDLKTKLVNDVSAAETWRRHHVQELGKTKALEIPVIDLCSVDL